LPQALEGREQIRTIADGLEWSHGWAVPAAQRLRFLLDFGYATGLRAGELVSVTRGGIMTGMRGERWLHLTGKGAKAGKVVLPPLARFALDQYLMQRGLPVSPARWAPDTPLLGDLDEPGGITTPRLREVLRRFFRLPPMQFGPSSRHSPTSCSARRHAGCATRTQQMLSHRAPR
jgi:integrase